MSATPLIRTTLPADDRAICAIVTAAFGQADEADLVDRLRADGDAEISLVAVRDSAIVGHVLLSRMQAPAHALGLAPVSVRPLAQGQGIGSALIRAALGMAREEGWKAVFVLGDPGYYTRFGFQTELAKRFESPYAGPHFMALELLPGALTGNGGTATEARYAPAFEAT